MSIGAFESLEEIGKVCLFIIEKRLNKTQIIFLNQHQHDKMTSIFKSLGASGIVASFIPDSNCQCDTIVFMGVTFNVVNVDKITNT